MFLSFLKKKGNSTHSKLDSFPPYPILPPPQPPLPPLSGLPISGRVSNHPIAQARKWDVSFDSSLTSTSSHHDLQIPPLYFPPSPFLFRPYHLLVPSFTIRAWKNSPFTWLFQKLNIFKSFVKQSCCDDFKMIFVEFSTVPDRCSKKKVSC